MSKADGLLKLGSLSAETAGNVLKWVGRTWSNPAVKQGVTQAAQAAGKTPPKTLKEMGRLLRENPDFAFGFALALGGLSGEVIEMFNQTERDDAVKYANSKMEGIKAMAQITAMAEDFGIIGLTDYERQLLRKTSETSEALGSLTTASAQDKEFMIKVLGWAVRRYGSVRAAKEAHIMSQAFFEMSADAVADGFKYLNIGD